MKHFVYTCSRQGAVYNGGQCVDARFQQTLQPGADHVERQEEHQTHDRDKNGDRSVLSGQNPVDLPASFMLTAFTRLCDAGVTDLHDKREPHIGDGCAAVQSALFFHLEGDMLQRFLLVFIKAELVDDQLIAFNRLAGGKPHRDACCLRVIFDQVDHRVQTSVHGAVVVVFVAEVLPLRLLLVFRNMDRVIHQFMHALIFRRGNRHDRNTQHGFHGVHIHRAAVAGHLVHHVQCHHDGDVHFQQLHGQIHVPFNIRDVNDVDDALRPLLQHEVAGDQLLAGIGRHGIDAGQIGNNRVRLSQDRAVLAVDRHTREIAHVLFGARQLVEQRCLAAVLVADQRKRQHGALGQRIAAAFRMETSAFTETEMLAHGFRRVRLLPHRIGGRFHFDLVRVVKPERQLISVETDLDRIAHRRVLHNFDIGAGNDAHIQEMLAQSAAPADCQHTCGLAFFYFLQCHGRCLFSLIKFPYL